MKKVYLIFLTLVTFSTLFAQQDGVIDDPGDIAFVAFHDNDDGFSFVFLDACPAGATIRFTDEGWNGTAFNSTTSEGEVLWTNNTGSIITLGTVVNITDADDNSDGINASVGTAAEVESGFTTGVANEQIYAITGTRAAPGTFLAFVGDYVNDGGSTTTLSGTGLVLGTTAVGYEDSEGYYSGPTNCNGTLTECLQMINNPANWSLGSHAFPSVVPNSFGGTVLPVELISFTAEVRAEQEVELNWVTAMEVNSEGFFIEYTQDLMPNRWTELAFVDSKNNYEQISNYSFTYENIHSGKTYYRLRQIDYDGQEAFSEVIAVNIQNNTTQAKLFPNPSLDGQTFLRFTTLSEDNLTVQVLNASAILLQEHSFLVMKGDNSLELNLKEKGLFYIRIIGTNYSYTEKLFVH